MKSIINQKIVQTELLPDLEEWKKLDQEKRRTRRAQEKIEKAEAAALKCKEIAVHNSTGECS